MVHKAAHDLSLKLEAIPDKFLRLDYLEYLSNSRERLAKLVNVHRDEIVLVSNVSAGIHTVLTNLEWEKEDIIISCTRPRTSLTLVLEPTHVSPYSQHDAPFPSCDR